jgi:hypothetical protein
MSRPIEKWQYVVGEIHRGRVRAYERADKSYTIWLYYSEPGQRPKQVSLGFTIRTENGRIVKERERQAKEAADAKRQELLAMYRGDAPVARMVEQDKPKLLTLGETEAMVIHPETGRYPHKNQYRDEVVRAIRYAVQVWGANKPWADIEADHFTALGRKRLLHHLSRGEDGVRMTEIIIARLLTIASWFREKGKIPPDAARAPERWKQQLKHFWREETKSRHEHKPSRPRHTPKQLVEILNHSWHVDPRFGTMMDLGFFLRAGSQVAMAQRVDLDLEAGTFVVHGKGDKPGTKVKLNEIQLEAVGRALGGYLRLLEAQFQAGELTDYFLFPGNPLRKMVAHQSTRPVAQWLVAGLPRPKNSPGCPTSSAGVATACGASRWTRCGRIERRRKPRRRRSGGPASTW